MSDSRRVARVGALVVALGVWSAVMAHPGLASADPTAETSSTSTGENPDRGDSDSRADLGMASSEGSTPSAGEGSVEHGSGPGDEPGPDPSGSTVRSDEPAPGVVISSSGGALTSEQHDQSPADPPSEFSDGGSQQTSAPAVEHQAPPTVAPPVTANPVTPATPVVTVEPSAVVTPPAATTIGSAVQTTPAESGHLAGSHPNRVVSTRISAIPGAPAMLDASEGGDTGSIGDPTPLQATPHARTLATQTSSVPDLGSESPLVSLRIVTSVLAAALAPFVMPVPGSPVQEPALWAIFAWARRQSEGKALTQQAGLLAAPRHTEMVGDGRPAGASRVADEPDVPTSAPAERLDARVPEAAVTGSIDVGDGLTYGLAVVGDRLYVLNSSYDTQDNGHVKMIDTSTGRVAGSIEVGRMPYALVVSGRSLYVGNAGDGTVSVVDVATNRVVDHIDVGATPYGLEATDDRLYVADHAGTVSVIDLFDNTEIARIPVEGDPFAVASTADHVYVTDYAGGTVAVFDQGHAAASDAIATASTNAVGLTAYPYSTAVVGGRLYVVNSATNALTIIDRSVTTAVHVDSATRAVDAIPRGAAPVDMIVRGDRLYVSNVNCGSVVVIDASTNQPVATIRVGIAPGLMAATPDGRTLYVADVMSGTVRVITSVHPGAGFSAA